MSDILDLGIEASREAGIFLLDNLGKNIQITSKGDRNLVTNLDKQAEEIIVGKIKARFPDHGIMAEEGGDYNIENEHLWIIDPLDGTHNYIRGISVFGVSIGIVYQGEFIAGIIYMPLEKELYTAEKGKGAYKNGAKISVSSRSNLSDGYLSFDSAIRYAPKMMVETLGHLAQEVFNVRMFGSSVRALSYIAEGKLDGSVEFYDKPWDFAGGVCLIEEAGGKIKDIKGGILSYKSVGYIASNGALHQKIEKIVASHYNL